MNEENIKRFCADLSELSRKHGLAIEGGVVFEMEGEDFQDEGYALDENGALIRR